MDATEQNKEKNRSVKETEDEEQVVPNPQLLKSLLDMGISKDIAEKALVKSNNASIEMAVALAVDDEDESDWNDVDENYKMVFVINSSLDMTTGKVAAQVAHGAVGLYRQLINNPEVAGDVYSWQDSGEKTIVLKGKDEKHLEDLHKKAMSLMVPSILIRDAGHTEVPPDSLTLLALFGEEKQVDNVTRELRLF